MNNGLIIDEIDNLCNVEYGTRVIKKNTEELFTQFMAEVELHSLWMIIIERIE